MKLIIGDFTAEVKAKNTRYSERNNVVDTVYLLNLMSIACGRAAQDYKEKGYEYMAADFDKMSNDIYAALKAAGAYKDI